MNDRYFFSGVAVFLIIPVILLAAGPLPAAKEKTFITVEILDQWSNENGLPVNTIYDITRTRDGYLWLGTTSGIIRYNGISFQPRGGEKYPQLKGKIKVLHTDNQGVLWIGSEDGLFKYENKEFVEVKLPKIKGKKRISTIESDIKGRLWVGCFFNTLIFRLEDQKFTLFNESNRLGGTEIQLIFEDSQADIWICVMKSGIYKFRSGELIKQQYKIDTGDCLFYSICEDSRGQLWIGTSRGLLRIKENNAVRFTVRDGLSSNKIRAVMPGQEGRLWLGTFSGICWLDQKGTQREVMIHQHQDTSYVYSLFMDPEESIWIGTNGFGLARFRKKPFKSYFGRSLFRNDYIAALLEEKPGKVWIGSADGLFLLERKIITEAVTPEHPLYNCALKAMTMDLEGNIWIGTDDNGIFRYNHKNWLQYGIKDGLSEIVVRSLMCDREGQVWIALLNSVNSFYQGKIVVHPLPDIELGSGIYDIYEDNQSNLWVSTGNGVVLVRQKDFSDHRLYLKGTLVSSVFQDSEGFIWIATQGRGLIRFDGEKFAAVRRAQGIPSEHLYQILEDDHDHFWIGSKDGVIRVSKRELHDLCDRKVKRISARLYGTKDGMQSHECSKFSRHSALATARGELWFATKKGISIVNPRYLKVNKTPPPVLIEGVKVNGENRVIYSGNQVFIDVARLDFLIGALTYIKPEKVRIRTDLIYEGKTFTRFLNGGIRTISYKNLPRGNYRLKITASNADGVWNLDGTTFSFTLGNSFLKSFFGRVIIFGTILLAGFLAVLAFLKRYSLKKKRRRTADIIRPQKAELYIKNLNNLLELEKIYRDISLTVDKLAERMRIPTRDLSLVINENLNSNFYNLLNHYRVGEAKEILHDRKHDHLTILEVAFKVGFNSKSAFNRAFKKETGLTPSAYKLTRIPK